MALGREMSDWFLIKNLKIDRSAPKFERRVYLEKNNNLRFILFFPVVVLLSFVPRATKTVKDLR